ncbi:MAG: right-handed parallel beta-helix repeat-containing protein [Polyangiaceae bacterium]
MFRSFSSRIALGVVSSVLAFACSKATSTPKDDLSGNIPPNREGTGGVTADGGVTIDGGAAPTICAYDSVLRTATIDRILYVSPSGSDAADGSEQTPWRTLANVPKLQPGDLLEVATGSYPCGFTLANSGTSERPILVHSKDGPSRALLDCSGSEIGITVTGSYVALIDFEIANPTGVAVQIQSPMAGTPAPSHVSLLGNYVHAGVSGLVRDLYGDDLEIVGNTFSQPDRLGPAEFGFAVDLVGVARALVLGNKVLDVTNTTGISVRGGSTDVLVDGNVVSSASIAVRLGGTTPVAGFRTPETAYEAKAVTVTNNVILGATSQPFEVSGCVDCLLAFNTVAVSTARSAVKSSPGNAGSAVTPSQSRSSGLRIVNDLFQFAPTPPSDVFAVAAEDAVGFTAQNDLFWSPGGSMSAVTTTQPLGATGNVVDKDPLLLDVASGDVRLGEGSPAKGVGTKVDGVRRDGTLGCRTANNIGAF